jgi:hypothetical protein
MLVYAQRKVSSASNLVLGKEIYAKHCMTAIKWTAPVLRT